MANETAIQVASQASPVRQTFEPTTLAEAMEFSKIIAESDLAPKDFRGKPANVLVALQLAKELNVPPMQGLQGIAVVNGRATVWGDLMWALVTNHPLFEDALEEITDTQAKVTLKRRGRSPVTVIFTKADAEKAGLWGKAGPWTQYPKRQLQWRARTFAARDLFPDALKGMISAEEASDYGPTIEGSVTPASVTAVAEAKKPEPEATIGKEKATAFFKAYKVAGHTPEESKIFLKETWDIEAPRNSTDIPVSGEAKAFEWANTPAPIRVKAEGLFETLGFTPEERVAFVNQHKIDWAKVAEELEAELTRRNAAEQ